MRTVRTQGAAVGDTPPNKALKLTAQGGDQIGCGAPQLNAVFCGLQGRRVRAGDGKAE